MREIKFRVWVTKESKVIQLDFETGHIMLKDCDIWDMNKVELMQFTGLKDKNGKEIYEGDIVKVNTQKLVGGLLQGVIRVGIVKWVNTGFSVKVDDEIELYSLKYPYSNDEVSWEVIGNIYENPDLLSPPDLKEKEER